MRWYAASMGALPVSSDASNRHRDLQWMSAPKMLLVAVKSPCA